MSERPNLTLTDEDLEILGIHHRESILGKNWWCYVCGPFPTREHKLYEFYLKNKPTMSHMEYLEREQDVEKRST